MSHEIIMPVLGMNQDTGIIASWQKSVGDYVNAGDVVMEVETDKAIQEIEVFGSGYLSQILYPAESDVPVGEVVGLITAEMPDAAELAVVIPAASAKTAESLVTDSEVVSTRFSNESVIKSTETPYPETELSPSDDLAGVILASAKARATAHKANILLRDVAAATGKSPLHAADVDEYLRDQQLEAKTGGLNRGSAQSISDITNQGIALSFKVKSKGLRHCEQWLLDSGVSAQPLLSSHLIATLVMGLWRELILGGSSNALTINVSCFGVAGFRNERLQDADKQRFSNLSPDATSDSGTADIQLIDLRHSRIENYQPNVLLQPLFIVSNRGKKTHIGLYGVSAGQSSAAIELMDSLAKQVEEPLIYIA